MRCRFGIVYGSVVLVAAYFGVSGRGTDASPTTVPSYLTTCHRKDPNLNTCVKNSINNIIRNIKNGSKEIDLPPIDPHHVDFVEVDEGSGNVSLKMTMTDVLMTGLSYTEVVAVKANVQENKFEIASKTPYVDIQGQFKAEGAVLNFPLVGSGNFWINMSDVTAVWIMYYQNEPHNGEMYLTIENLGLDVIPSDVRYSFGDMLDGDNKLGEAMNQFLNENSHEIFNELKPRAIKIFNQIFTDIANHFLSKYAADDLLPE